MPSSPRSEVFTLATALRRAVAKLRPQHVTPAALRQITAPLVYPRPDGKGYTRMLPHLARPHQIRRALEVARDRGWLAEYPDGWGLAPAEIRVQPRQRAARAHVVERARAVTQLVTMIGGLVPTRPLGSPLGLRHAQLLGALSEAVRRGWLQRVDVPGRPPRWFVPVKRNTVTAGVTTLRGGRVTAHERSGT
jgi:hypothetical protein